MRPPSDTSELTLDAAGQKAKSSVFRRAALEHHANADTGTAEVLRVSPPWTWALFLVLGISVGSALLVSFIAEVDITSKGKGVLRAVGGARTLHAQVGGVVAEVNAFSGESVRARQTLFRLESAAIETMLLEADRRLELLRSARAKFIAHQEQLYGRRTGLLSRKVALLEKRRASISESIARLERRSQSFETLGDKGIVGALTRDEASEQIAQAERQRLSAEEESSQIRLENAALDAQRGADRWHWEEEIENALTRRNSLRFSLEQTEIVAPQDGYLESVLVRPGDVVQPGNSVGRLIASGLPKQIVAFLPEKDRAFVTEGSEIRVEIEQLPYAEFGTLRGKVKRVASDLAGATEISESLGEGARLPGPAYRVELTLIEDDRVKELSPRLRPGMLIHARFKLRTRRLIALILDPLRRWFR